jgi:predicted nucleic acid-binding protein
MNTKTIVLDANILIRAVLGQRVSGLIRENAPTVRFYAPDAAYAEAEKHLSTLLAKRGMNPVEATSALDHLEKLVHPIEFDVYVAKRHQALPRIAKRDPDDWPVLACALMLGCPVWTEDTDFFGTGVATWTTDRIDLYLA